MRLFLDFLPVALFFIAYKTHGIYVATGVAIVGALAVTGISWIRHRRVEQMQLVTLALIVLLGGLTLMLNDSRFIQWKPTLVNWCFAAAFLGSAFIGEKPLIQRLLGAKLALPRPVWHRLGLDRLFLPYRRAQPLRRLRLLRSVLGELQAVRAAGPDADLRAGTGGIPGASPS